MATLTESAPPLVSELNISHYLELLRRRWLLISICCVLGLAAALGSSYLSPKLYMTRVELAIVRTGTLVNFDPKFRTVSDNDPNAQGLDQVSRRRSLVAIGDTPAFASLIIEKIGPQLPEALRDPYELGRHISVGNDGDIIRTYVSGDSPEMVALIANTWGELYQERVNQTFSENALSTDALLTQVDEAKTAFDTAEANLTAFIQSSPYERLRRDTDVLATKLNRLGDLEAKLSSMEADAQSLRAMLNRGTADVTPADTLSALMMQVNTFNNIADTPIQVTIPLTGVSTPLTRAQQIQQVDDLIKTIQERRATLDGKERDDMLAQLSSLQAQMEQAQSKRKELEATRDLTWNTLQLLNSKVAENNVISQTSSQLVRIATPAIVPTEPVNTRRWVFAVLGALVGLVVGSVLALFVPSR